MGPIYGMLRDWSFYSCCWVDGTSTTPMARPCLFLPNNLLGCTLSKWANGHADKRISSSQLYHLTGYACWFCASDKQTQQTLAKSRCIASCLSKSVQVNNSPSIETFPWHSESRPFGTLCPILISIAFTWCTCWWRVCYSQMKGSYMEWNMSGSHPAQLVREKGRYIWMAIWIENRNTDLMWEQGTWRWSLMKSPALRHTA